MTITGEGKRERIKEMRYHDQGTAFAGGGGENPYFNLNKCAESQHSEMHLLSGRKAPQCIAISKSKQESISNHIV